MFVRTYTHSTLKSVIIAIPIRAGRMVENASLAIGLWISVMMIGSKSGKTKWQP
jgi:hypothetical protein